jgi:hypothetical protein
MEPAHPAPPVLTWYRVYCAAMAAIYLACAVAGVFIVLFNEQIAESEPHDEPWLWILYGGGFMLLGLVFTAIYVYAFFAPRRPWAWVYHLVLICFGLTSCCCMPASIPLLVFWLRPATQRYFGRLIT